MSKENLYAAPWTKNDFCPRCHIALEQTDKGALWCCPLCNNVYIFDRDGNRLLYRCSLTKQEEMQRVAI